MFTYSYHKTGPITGTVSACLTVAAEDSSKATNPQVC